MSNISKFINVLNTYLEVESFSPLVYKFPINIVACESSSLDKSIMSYIENGFLLRCYFHSSTISFAYLQSPRDRGYLVASCFGNILDVLIPVNRSLTFSEHAFAIIIEYFTSKAFKCLFSPMTHFSVDAHIPGSLFVLRCSLHGVNNFITFKGYDNYYTIEIA